MEERIPQEHLCAAGEAPKAVTAKENKKSQKQTKHWAAHIETRIQKGSQRHGWTPVLMAAARLRRMRTEKPQSLVTGNY